MAQPPSRPEARSRFGSQSANELGAPVASSMPEQLPGREPASARKGYEDALVLRNLVSKDRLDVTVLPEEQCSSVSNDRAGWADLVERHAVRRLHVGRAICPPDLRREQTHPGRRGHKGL